MEFDQVIKTCLDFSIANGGTIATYPVGNYTLEVHSRTTRMEILVDMIKPGIWLVKQKQNDVGERSSEQVEVLTEEHLLEHLSRFWKMSTDESH